MAAEQNTIMADDLARAREVDFAFRFNASIKKLVEALGITRKIPKVAGTVLKAYKATGELQDGKVAEGDLIPLSHYVTEPVLLEEIVLKKWRKQTTAEAIIEKGRNQAVNMTNEAMLKDVQKGIRADFFSFLTRSSSVLILLSSVSAILLTLTVVKSCAFTISLKLSIFCRIMFKSLSTISSRTFIGSVWGVQYSFPFRLYVPQYIL